MALPKLSTGALNIYADPHLGSEISPTTSPAASSKPEDSDPNYTLNYEEPVIAGVDDAGVDDDGTDDAGLAGCSRPAWLPLIS